MTAYEKAVIKAFLNEAFGQMSAEVDGQTIIPGYFDTDSSYPKVGTSIGFNYNFTVMINDGVKVDDEIWETVKRCVINRYYKCKHVLPRRNDFFVYVYIPADINKPFNIKFRTKYPILKPGQTVYYCKE